MFYHDFEVIAAWGQEAVAWCKSLTFQLTCEASDDINIMPFTTLLSAQIAAW